MEKPKGIENKELPLFDFPLGGGDADLPEEEAPEVSVEVAPTPSEGAQSPSQLSLVEAEPTRPAVSEPPRPLHRLLAGLLDLAIHVGTFGLTVGAVSFMGVRLDSGDWPPLMLFALTFSFLYFVVPLSFWGQTPGMTWFGHLARCPSREPLTVLQTILRWIGALVTLALAGLPLLLALRGRSLSDRLSDSKTVRL